MPAEGWMPVQIRSDTYEKITNIIAQQTDPDITDPSQFIDTVLQEQLERMMRRSINRGIPECLHGGGSVVSVRRNDETEKLDLCRACRDLIDLMLTFHIVSEEKHE